ncbi:MAG: hypothetical protein MN733_08680 [Nitrososphaera sp.]|nr:hypothetical protein [Nitrososphaera sp.]
MDKYEEQHTETMQLKHETSAAYLLVDDTGKEHWLPKSKISLEPGKSKRKSNMPVFEVTMPEWLAKKRDLL